MPKKLQFPVAKIREDGTPAIWLTHTHWLILEDGIVHRYLREREHEGRYRARQELRKLLGKEWGKHSRLREWETLDMGHVLCSNIQASFELWLVGYRAWGHVAARIGDQRWTPETLLAKGDQIEARGFEEERKTLVEIQQEAAA